MNPQENMVYHFSSLSCLRKEDAIALMSWNKRKYNKNTADTLGRWHKGTDFGYQCRSTIYTV